MDDKIVNAIESALACLKDALETGRHDLAEVYSVVLERLHAIRREYL